MTDNLDKLLKRAKAHIPRKGETVAFTVDADQVLLSRSAGDEISLNVSSGEETHSVQTRTWPPCSNKPSDYPAGLPFLPDVMAVTIVPPESGHASVHWYRLSNRESATVEIERQCLSDGWLRVPSDEDRSEEVLFERGTQRRVVVVATSGDCTFGMVIQGRRGSEAVKSSSD